MDLVRIFYMVDTPSSGKRGFNHIYVVGLIVSILIHFESVLFILVFSVSGIHSMFMFWYGYCWLFQECCLVSSFSYCVFSQSFHSIFTGTWCCSVFHGIVWFPILLVAFMDDHDVDHPIVVYTENVYIEVHIHQHLYIYIFLLFVPTFQYPFIITI